MNDRIVSGDKPLFAYGTPMHGGYFGGIVNISGERWGIALADKAQGEINNAIWLPDYIDVPGATSVFDGVANTNAMAEAGSPAALWARGLRIEGHDDWYLLSMDEKEIVYRNLKPTTEKNYCYLRSGTNVSALPPTYGYTPTFPLQTTAEAFKAGGAQAFEPGWYLTSTQYSRVDAWYQHFSDGLQTFSGKLCELHARVARRFKID